MNVTNLTNLTSLATGTHRSRHGPHNALLSVERFPPWRLLKASSNVTCQSCPHRAARRARGKLPPFCALLKPVHEETSRSPPRGSIAHEGQSSSWGPPPAPCRRRGGQEGHRRRMRRRRCTTAGRGDLLITATLPGSSRHDWPKTRQVTRQLQTEAGETLVTAHGRK